MNTITINSSNCVNYTYLCRYKALHFLHYVEIMLGYSKKKADVIITCVKSFLRYENWKSNWSAVCSQSKTTATSLERANLRTYWRCSRSRAVSFRDKCIWVWIGDEITEEMYLALVLIAKFEKCLAARRVDRTHCLLNTARCIYISFYTTSVIKFSVARLKALSCLRKCNNPNLYAQQDMIEPV